MEEVQAFTPSRGAAAEVNSGALASVAGGLPLLCHEAVLTPETAAAMHDCGAPVCAEIATYRNRDDYLGQVRERMAAGQHAWFTHVVPEEVFPADRSMVAPDLLRRMNDKTAMEVLVPAGNVPPRLLVDGTYNVAAALAGLAAGTVVKAVGGATSGGAGVLVVRSARHAAEARRRFAGCDRLIIEKRLAIRRNLNIQLAVYPDGRIEELGASEQVCSRRGVYLGNRIVPDATPSAAMRALARQIAEAGSARGFRGVCGFDIVEDADGQCFAIDLNFRPNGSTPLLLLHGVLGAQRAMPCAAFAYSTGAGSVGEWLSRLRMHFDAGWLVLAAAYATVGAAASRSPAALRLVVMAQEPGELRARLSQLTRAGLTVASHPPGLLERVRRSARRRLSLAR